MRKEKNIKNFTKDTDKYGGYVYTKNEKLSSYIANKHQTEITLQLVKIKNKEVIDIGCGDGTYTQEWYRLGRPKNVFGFDPSVSAIKSARKNNKFKKHVSYKVGNIYKIPTNKTYDLAIVRGVLHHLYEPEKGIKEISKIAKKVILIEPNGYNPILKIIEKTSRYHIEHEEKSYYPFLIDRWVKKYSGTIKIKKFAAIVPFFCPDWAVKILKSIEPFVESIPFVRSLLCSNYYLVYENKF